MLHDLRYAIRRIVWRPWTSLLIAGTLALGIGANAAVFSLVDDVLLRRLPFAHPDRLVVLDGAFDVSVLKGIPKVWLDFTDWRARRDIFADVGTYTAGAANLSGPAGARRVHVTAVTPDFFSLLGLPPAKGRAFRTNESVPGREMVAVISDALWHAAFHAAPDAIGRTLTLNAHDYTVVGIARPGMAFPDSSDVWIPRTIPIGAAQQEMFKTRTPLVILGRLQPSLALADARARVSAVERTFAADTPGAAARDDHVVLEPLAAQLRGDASARLFAGLALTAAFLLLACVNVAGVLMARNRNRRREFAVRRALGASGGRLIRESLAEAALLSLGGMAGGVALALFLQRAVAAMAPAGFAGLATPEVDAARLAFVVGVAGACTLLVGAAPALAARRPALGDALRAGGRTFTGGNWGGRAAVVIAQVALSAVLLTVAGLTAASVLRLQRVPKGFDAGHVVTANVSLPLARYGTTGARTAFGGALTARLDAEAGLSKAGVVSYLPMSGGSASLPVAIVGRPVPPHRYGQLYAEYLTASPGYFGAMGVPVLAGRNFTAADDANAPRVAIVDAQMAARYWPKSNPVGARLKIPFDTGTFTVVGVVGRVRDQSLRPANHWHGELYLSWRQMGTTNLSVVGRTSLGAGAGEALLQRAVASVDPALPVYDARPMDAVVAASIAPERTTAALIDLSALLGLLVTVVGIYGAVAESVAGRRAELGVRMALGATARDVLALVGRQSLRLIGAGLAIGLVGGWLSARAVAHLLYGSSAGDVTVYLVVLAILGACGTVAWFIPAWRATRVNPTSALQAE